MPKNKKLATAAGSLAIVAAAVAITAGTYSYFSDQNGNATVGTNAGTLTVDIGGMSTNDTAKIGNMAPGDAIYRRFTVTNTGTLPGSLTLKMKTTDSGPNDILDDTLIAHVYDLTDNLGVGYSNPFSAMTAADYPASNAGVMAPGVSKTFLIKLLFPNGSETHDNAYQGKTTSFSVQAKLTQDPLPAS